MIRLRGSQKVIGTAQHRLEDASEEPAGRPLISISMLTCFIKMVILVDSADFPTCSG